jgi:hypothetical protein
MGNSDDEVILLDGSSNEIDRVEYDNGTTFPDPTGASMVLQDPALDNNAGANWCESTTAYGDGDRGTPGSVNDCLPPPATTTSIYAIQYTTDPSGDSPLKDQAVTTEGVVTAVFGSGYFIQDPEETSWSVYGCMTTKIPQAWLTAFALPVLLRSTMGWRN